jgi:hypothetical protein
MIIPCSHCSKTNPIVYNDYDFGSKTSIKLCWDCLKFLGWNTEMGDLFPLVKKCNGCKQFYLSRKASSTKCYVCWNEFFNPKIKLEVIHEDREFQQLQEVQRALL